MNKRTTIKQQLLAGCLLTIFLFITFAKLLHSHENSGGISFSSHTEQVVKSSDCSICDYHFAKDAYHFNELPQVKEIELIIPSYSFYNTPFVTSIGSISSGRGPPALV